jgi:DNA-binding transcriptional ArsR family regulator
MTSRSGRLLVIHQQNGCFRAPTQIIVLTDKIVGIIIGSMHDQLVESGLTAAMPTVAVIDDPDAASIALDPMRARLLAELSEPASATMLAERVGLTRQKVNYHLRALEEHGLVELVEERRRGNMTERMLRATAMSFVISPNALASVAPDPERSKDQLSAWWLLALAARLVRDVGDLITGAAVARAGLATFAIDGEIRFATAQARSDFVTELSAAVADLAQKYNDARSDGGRPHRLVFALHPKVKRSAGAA